MTLFADAVDRMYRRLARASGRVGASSQGWLSHLRNYRSAQSLQQRRQGRFTGHESAVGEAMHDSARKGAKARHFRHDTNDAAGPDWSPQEASRDCSTTSGQGDAIQHKMPVVPVGGEGRNVPEVAGDLTLPRSE